MLAVHSFHPADAANTPIESATVNGNQLTAITVGGKSYPQAQMVGATLTAFAASSTGCVLIPNGAAIPASGTRAGLVGDWLLDSGIINPSTAASSCTATFPQAIVNRQGPDIVFMEINPGTSGDSMVVTINGVSQTVSTSDWGTSGFSTSSADQYSPGSIVGSLAALESATLTSASAEISQTVLGVALDLADFNVPENGTVTQISYHATSTGSAVDPVFIGGFTGSGVLPPGAVSLPYVETFTASQGAFTTSAEWTSTGTTYRNTLASSNAVSSVSIRTNDLAGDPAPGFFLSSKFTIVTSTSSGNAVGFALFGSNPTFSGGVTFPYYLMDFRPSANVLRFLRVGINNTAFLPDSTLQTMTVDTAQPFFLEVSGTYETGVLRMAVTVRQGAKSETFFVIDSEPLNIGYFGYRNRTGSGTLTVDCDDFTLRHLSTDTFTTSPDPFARPGQLYSSPVAATSDVGATVTVSATTLPSWLTFTPGANGTGTLSGTPSTVDKGSHAVTLLATDNESGSLQQTFHISVLEPTGVFISEFLAENDSGLRDEDDDQPDWIELFNSDATPANIGGFWLSDDPLLPKKWALPAGTTIPARGFLVVFASGKNRLADPAHLHTNFALSNSAGGIVSLAQPDGTIISSFSNYPEQRADRSYGAYGNYTTRGYLLTPTPGAPNDPVGYLGFVADTSFSVKRGFYTTAQTVTVSCATPGATLYYTTNGSPPSPTNGAPSASPLTLNIASSTVLRVVAHAPGMAPSGPDTQSYFFLEDIRNQPTAAPAGWPTGPVNGQVLQYGMDTDITNTVTAQQMKDALGALPSLSLVTDLPNLFSAEHGIYTNPYGREEGSECPVSVELINPDNTPGFHINAGLRIRGGASREATNPKHNFHLYFRGAYGAPKLQYPLFGDEGVDEYDRVDLRTAQVISWHKDSSSAATYTRDEWNRATHGAMGQPYTRSRYYHLYINGHYWGIYGTQERADSDYAASYFGGKKSDYDVMKTYVIPHRVAAADGDNAAWTQLFNAATAGFSTDAAYYAVQGLDANGNPSATKPLLDVDNLIDYNLLRFYAADTDGPVNTGVGVPKNFYAIRPRDGSFGYRFFTHDSESVMTTSGTDVTTTISTGNSLLYFNPRWLSQQMAANAKYRLRFADRAQKHLFNGGALDNPVAITRWNSFRSQLSTAILAESARWGDGAGPNHTVAEWNSANTNVENNFIAVRRAILIGQLRARSLFPSIDAPSFSQHGGLAPANYALTITGPAGTTLHYTLNSTDPSAAAAATYSGAVTLSGTQVTVKARAKHNTTGEWSALTEALFTLGASSAAPGNLAISEIHYNPPGSADDTEFIELVNRSANRLDLTGVHLTSAVIYTFGNVILEPGARICVGESSTAFTSAYPTATFAGEWSGALNNSGDTIILLDKNGAEIERVTYGDVAPWPTDADGNGYSLVRINPASDATNATSWRASTAIGGNAGGSDTATFSGTPFADIDGDQIAAVLEHFLGTADNTGNASPLVPGRLPDGRMTLTFPRRLGADDVTYTVEASANLTNWNLPVTRTNQVRQANGIVLETWTVTTTVGPQHMRVRVSY